MCSSFILHATFATFIALGFASPIPPSDIGAKLVASSSHLVSRGNQHSIQTGAGSRRSIDELLINKGHEIFGYSFAPDNVKNPALSDLQVPGQDGERALLLFRERPRSVKGYRTCIIVTLPEVRRGLKNKNGMARILTSNVDSVATDIIYSQVYERPDQAPLYSEHDTSSSTVISFSVSDQQYTFVHSHDNSVMHLPKSAQKNPDQFHIACLRIKDETVPPDTWIRAQWDQWDIPDWQPWDPQRQYLPIYTE
ncbi:hypothetical protein J3R30DRAFT_3732946 [Lentinula aciculospora]|uniref:Uncharacterized protein n=1 Tax=Lentinula aciculospora TaxID=153920 RepID=A0A9W9DQ74_9AGAR|nr:hypothetical protein J3R30DRAFT_3732946 [Lentinula aciculospora]